MKVFCLIFLTVLGTSLAVPTRSRSRHQNAYSSKFDKDKFQDGLKQFLDSCSLTEDDLTAALERVSEKAQEIDMDHTHVCDCISEHFMDIVEPLTDLIDTNCNKQLNLGNLGKAFALSLQSVFRYICESDGRQLMELLHPCLYTEDTNGESDKECVERVMGQYESRMEDYVVNSNVLNYVCESMQDAYGQCIEPKVKRRCKMQMSWDVFTRLIEAFMDPCNEEARLMK